MALIRTDRPTEAGHDEGSRHFPKKKKNKNAPKEWRAKSVFGQKFVVHKDHYARDFV